MAWGAPIALFGSANFEVAGGEQLVRGRTLKDLGQDLVDGLTHCADANGGWHYFCGREDIGRDVSTSAWTASALELLERRLGVNTYPWARDAYRQKLNQSCTYQNNDDPMGFGCVYHCLGVARGVRNWLERH